METTSDGGTEDARALEGLNLSIADWEQSRDQGAIEKLDGCLSSDLLFRRADRAIVDKKTFMDGLRGPSPFKRRESKDLSVKISGDHALAIVTVVATKLDEAVHHYRNIRVFLRRDGRWRLEVWFNDEVTDLPGL